MTEVIPGIHQLRLPVSVQHSSVSYANIYLIQDGDRAMLVDAGLNRDSVFESFKQELAGLGLSVEDISRVVVTHAHYDHVGLVGRLKRASSARFLIHELEKDFIESAYRDLANYLERGNQWMETNGMPPEDLRVIRAQPSEWSRVDTDVTPDGTFHGGETVSAGPFTFQVLWTPGHSAGHICLYEAAHGLLFSGDSVLPTITPHIGVSSPSGGNPLDTYLKTLDTLKRLDVRLVLPGHEDPFRQLRPRIEQIIEHHRHRRQEIEEGLKSGPKNAYEVASGINWVYRGGWQKLPLLHKRLALTETIAHLESMRASGKVTKLARDTIIYYRLT